jgi:quercetin dioxygenase-like cupin family protein
MYVIDFHDRELLEVDLKGSKKATVRWLVGKRTGAINYAMRLFEIAPGGIIPLHNHNEEHEIFVLDGNAKILGASEGHAEKNDIIFIPQNEAHGFDNTTGTESFRFICVIPLLNKD